MVYYNATTLPKVLFTVAYFWVVIKAGMERNGMESIGGRVTQVLLNRLYISMIPMILPIYLGCSIRNISLFSNYS